MGISLLEVPVLYPSPEDVESEQEFVAGFVALRELLSPKYITRTRPCTVGSPPEEGGAVVSAVQVYMVNETEPLLVGLPYEEFKKRITVARNLELEE